MCYSYSPSSTGLLLGDLIEVRPLLRSLPIKPLLLR
jgi:hypothetical protein